MSDWNAKKVCKVFVLLLCLTGNLAQAHDDNHNHRWELWTGSMADYTLILGTKTMTGGFLGSRVAVSPSIGYLLSDTVEALLAPSFYFHNSGNYIGRLMIGVGGNFFGKSVNDSFYGKLMFGFDDLLNNKASDHINFTLSNFVWSVSGGKRFEIAHYFSYSPEIVLTFEHESYSVINSLSFVPLQFSLFF